MWVGAMVTTGGLEEVGTTRGEGPRWYLDGVEAELRVVLAGEVLGEISSGPLSLACLASLRRAAAKLEVRVAAKAWLVPAPPLPLVTVTVLADWLKGVTVAVVRLALLLAEDTTVKGGGLVLGPGGRWPVESGRLSLALLGGDTGTGGADAVLLW